VIPRRKRFAGRGKWGNALQDTPKLEEEAQRAVKALAVGVGLFALDIGAALVYLAVNIGERGSIGMDILSVVAVFAGFVGILVLFRIRNKIGTAMANLRQSGKVNKTK
jgi:hypothetical protein